MKIKVFKSEEFPVFYVNEGGDYGWEVEFTEEEYRDFREVEDRWGKWQGKLCDKLRSLTNDS